jgi:hypothetical protein
MEKKKSDQKNFIPEQEKNVCSMLHDMAQYARLFACTPHIKTILQNKPYVSSSPAEILVLAIRTIRLS